MSENPYTDLEKAIGRIGNKAWQEGHDSRDAEVAELKRQVDELREAISPYQIKPTEGK